MSFAVSTLEPLRLEARGVLPRLGVSVNGPRINQHHRAAWHMISSYRAIVGGLMWDKEWGYRGQTKGLRDNALKVRQFRDVRLFQGTILTYLSIYLEFNLL